MRLSRKRFTDNSMRQNAYKYLGVTRFSSLGNWSVGHLLKKNIGFTDKYPVVAIGQIITRSLIPIEIKDDILYDQVTLKTNGGGAVPRGKKIGKEIGTKKQFIVFKGQFIMSKIDARNGAFGIISKELDGAVVTADFPVFDVDASKVLPEYLERIASTKKFAKFAQSCSRGATNRQRIDVELFLSQEIPLPSLAEQKSIVKAYYDKIRDAEMLENQAKRTEEEMLYYLLTELGIKENAPAYIKSSLLAKEPLKRYITLDKRSREKDEYSYLRIIKFAHLNEWGVDKIKTSNKKKSFKYPTKKVKEICSLGSGGTPSRARPIYYNGNIPWIKTGEVLNEEIFDTNEHISNEAVENSSARIYPKGSLIIAMYGQGDTRGRTAKLGVDAATNQACAVLFNINNTIVLTDFLWYYFQSRYDDLRSLASGNNQPNLSAKKINDYDVIIPPISVQNEIVKSVKKMKTEIQQLKENAQKTRSSALASFEQEIFR